jgi:hypothetical protein
MGTFPESVGQSVGLAPVIVASARPLAQVNGGIANVLTFSLGFDASFLASMNVNCTAFTSGSLAIQCQYTNENNVAQTPAFQGHFSAGYGVSITGTGSFEGQPLHIKAKGGTPSGFAAVSTAFLGTYLLEAYLIRIG